MLPPGRASDATRPFSTGKSDEPSTTGVAGDICTDAAAISLPLATSTSIGISSSSFTRPGSRSWRPSEERQKIRVFCPTTQPRSRNPCISARLNGLVGVGPSSSRIGTL